MSEISFVVVFGSAATFVSARQQAIMQFAGSPSITSFSDSERATIDGMLTDVRRPRDLDIVFGGNVSAHDAETTARQWAAANGLPADLPVDLHRQYVSKTCPLFLPVPMGMAGSSFTLRAPVDFPVLWQSITTIPAIIRAQHSDPAVCADMIAAYISHGMQPKRSLRLNIDPAGFCGDMSPGESYTGDGVRALRNAVSHCTGDEWAQIVAALDAHIPAAGAVLSRLVAEDVPSIVLDSLRHGASGVGITLDYAEGFGFGTPHGDRATSTVYADFNDLAARLWDASDPQMLACRAEYTARVERSRRDAAARDLVRKHPGFDGYAWGESLDQNWPEAGDVVAVLRELAPDGKIEDLSASDVRRMVGAPIEADSTQARVAALRVRVEAARTDEPDTREKVRTNFSDERGWAEARGGGVYRATVDHLNAVPVCFPEGTPEARYNGTSVCLFWGSLFVGTRDGDVVTPIAVIGMDDTESK